MSNVEYGEGILWRYSFIISLFPNGFALYLVEVYRVRKRLTINFIFEKNSFILKLSHFL